MGYTQDTNKVHHPGSVETEQLETLFGHVERSFFLYQLFV